MSQTVVFMEVNGVIYPDNLGGYPDRDEAISVAKEMVDDDLIALSDDYEVFTEWYEIGDGESGMDTFFSSDALVSWRKADVFEKNVEDAGYPVDCIEHRSFFLHGEEVNETED